MKAAAVTLSLLVAATLLAGCGSPEPVDIEVPPVDATTGAITGIVIDDRYRPVPQAELLLTPVAQTTIADDSGQFSFGNLAPGPYVLHVVAPGHEAAPFNVDVQAGQYAEPEILARRTFSQGAYTVTTQYSVFIPCSIDFIANGYVADCTGDQSGDTFRPGFTSDYTAHSNNVTYLVSEMLANQDARYEVQIRCEQNAHYYSVDRMQGTYSRMQLKYNTTATEKPVPPEYGETYAWDNKCKSMYTILFTDSQFREELQGADPVGIICCGLGAQFGIKAKFVQTLFLGEPPVDVNTYAVLKPAGQ